MKFNFLTWSVCLCLAFISINPILAQDPSAVTEFESTDKGLLIPRMTTAQRVLIDSPAEGLMVYDTDESTFYYYSMGSWSTLGGASSPNYSTIGASNFPSSPTVYAGPWTNNNNTVEEDARFPMPAGTLSELRVTCPATSDQNMVITVMKNGVDTNVTCTIAAGTNSCQDLTNEVIFNGGDGLTFKTTRPGSSPGKYLRMSVKWMGQ